MVPTAFWKEHNKLSLRVHLLLGENGLFQQPEERQSQIPSFISVLWNPLCLYKDPLKHEKRLKKKSEKHSTNTFQKVSNGRMNVQRNQGMTPQPWGAQCRQEEFYFPFSQTPCENSALRAGFTKNVSWSSNINISYLSKSDWNAHSRFGGKMTVPFLFTCIFFWCKTNPSFQTQLLYKSKGLHWHHWQAWTFIGWVTTKTRLLWATFMLILHVLSLSLSVSFTPLELSINFSSWRSYSPQYFTGYEWRKLWFSQSHYEPSTWQVRALILTVSWE